MRSTFSAPMMASKRSKPFTRYHSRRANRSVCDPFRTSPRAPPGLESERRSDNVMLPGFLELGFQPDCFVRRGLPLLIAVDAIEHRSSVLEIFERCMEFGRGVAREDEVLKVGAPGRWAMRQE